MAERISRDKDNGGTLRAELLRPRSWIAEHEIRVGETTHMELLEAGATGEAEVLSIGPCPSIQRGAGSIVTGTFVHSAADTLDLYIAGSREPIGCTAVHPFWSEDRRAFVPAGDLLNGEHLRTADGRQVQVERKTPRGGPEGVYNIEVDIEHAYYVSKEGILVHNAGPICGGAGENASSGRGGPYGNLVSVRRNT